MGKYIHIEREILIYAFRYALGRMSFAPVNIIETIKDNINNISDYDLRLFIKEIEECENYGMEMDEELWKNFIVYLQNELNRRTKK